jgi:hypothetical protein
LTTSYCDEDDVKARLAAGNFSADWDASLDEMAGEVSAELDREVAAARGIRAPWSFVADAQDSERRYTGLSGGRRYLAIDDCVEVVSVSSAGAVLVADVDFVVDPLNSLPIFGLVRLRGAWSEKPGDNVASCRWGFADSTAPADVKGAATRELIRAYLALRAGNDDRLGLSPFGQVITSKAFTAQTWALIHSYARHSGSAR